ncbi:MAG: ABC transporter ATP-binding protein/permease [Clostridiales bacterium]|nr:ABC transporter ATP-binding protein/permease [Clostridiales bacterium]
MIKISNLNKYYNKGKQNEIHVINDVSLNLPEKGMVAIFGKSGCGKTTLLNAVGGLDGYESGEILINGKSVKNFDAERNKYVGYIFQNYNLHADQTCFENVANALKLCGMHDEEEIEKRVISALKNVDMEKYKNRTPDTLSGGQQQRIAIARAIVKNPPVILADEPTGNLDEANTLLVMDLLKKIAKDHLVLIVTHEENLVDHYCDTVVELLDGRVNSVYQNENAQGYESRDKNAIYLGEFQKTESLIDGASVEFYGEAPQSPVKIQIVNNGGNIYLKVNTPKVQILDENSEVKLKKGVFTPNKNDANGNEQIDMSNLPPVQGKDYGKLFTLGNAIKSGYTANFAKKKKGKRFLRVLMGMFAAVVVFMTSMFGVMFRDLEEISDSYNEDVFAVDQNYLYHAFAQPYAVTLLNAIGSEDSAIDTITSHYNYGLDNVRVVTGFFESYSAPSAYAQAHYLEESVCKDMPVVLGKNANLNKNEVVITTALADLLLESVQVDYFNSYENLINCFVDLNLYTFTNNSEVKIAGVVKSSSKAVYLSALNLAYANGMFYSNIYPASELGLTVLPGESTLVAFSEEDDTLQVQLNESFKIRGKQFTLTQSVVNDEIDAPYLYVINDQDYITVSKLYSDDTHGAISLGYGEQYILVHSTNPAVTEAFLLNSLGESRFETAVITPSTLREYSLVDYASLITVNATSLIIILAVMSLCMYFIMRSSLMVRIKEVGVYRAIGVCKRNIIFRFLVEAAVLTTLTVFIGYLISSVFLFVCLGGGSLVGQILYYPVWIAIAVLVFLYAICLICGILPVLTLLSKTPSQILAKYDI